MHWELHINDLKLLALGVHFSVVKAVGFFQFVSVLGFGYCEYESIAKYIDFPVSLSAKPLASRRFHFF
jgi:hypothetical protein